MKRLRRLLRPLLDAAHEVRRRREQGPISTERFVGEARPAGGGAFDGGRAFALLEAQCALGPRAPGTDGHARCAAWMADRLREVADEVALQRWDQRVTRGPGTGRTFAMTNLIALVRGTEDDGRPALMLSAHWDTRPVADHDPDPARRTLPVPGANDGASGVAAVLEAARALAAARPRRSVVLALWDGEDLGEYYYGSRAFRRAARRPGGVPWLPREGIVLDMVGKRDLRCSTEENSRRLNPGLWARTHAAAEALGLGAHFGGPPLTITDDHVFLSRAGIPSIVLIDYTDPRWHTTHDTVEHCDARSLQAVGDVVLRVAREESGR